MSNHIVCTLDINYPSIITDITFPFMKEYATNIGAKFLILNERKSPHLPITLEKFQLYELNADHITFLDADVLVNPRALDFSKISKNEIVIAETLDGSDFSLESIPGKEKIRIHSAFLSFSKENNFVVEPEEDPLQYAQFILSDKKEWNLDEFVMSLNILKHGANLIDLKRQMPNTITHLGGHNITLDEKVEFLKKNLKILKQQELLHYV